MLYQPLVIESIHEEVEGFKTFRFKEGHQVSYKAGQYLTFVLHESEVEIRRSYSIVSSPLLNEPLTIGVKRVENGAFSRKLVDHAKPGDVLLCSGAGGFFTLPVDMDSFDQVFFLAAGSGITPVLSLLKTVLHLHQQKAVLVYSNSSAEKTIFLEQLNTMATQFSGRLDLKLLFSDSADLSAARLNRELLQTLLSKHLHCDSSRALFYICGPEAYMRMCTYTLQEEQVPKENIRRENFIIQKISTPHPQPPDKHTHAVKIQYGNEHYQFEVAYPDSILRAAKKQGITLPYSCETGRCGNCAAQRISGNVWMSYNEVLTEKDLQHGLTLTCVGHPVGGDVVLRI